MRQPLSYRIVSVQEHPSRPLLDFRLSIAVLEDPTADALEAEALEGPAFEPLPKPPRFPAFPHIKTEEDAQERARVVAARHRKGLERRRQRDLLAEKNLAHLSGDMWVDVVNGTLMPVPQVPGSYRTHENRLSMLVANMVAYHTSSPYRFRAQPRADLKDRRFSVVDTAIANDIAESQGLNQMVAAALSIGAAYGHGILRAVFREDAVTDPYPTIAGAPEASLEAEGLDVGGEMRRGFVDIYLGDPWSTVYDPGATRFGVHRESHERITPIEIVRRAFPQAPEIEELKPSPRIVSASRYQRMQASLNSISNWTGSASLAVEAPSGEGKDGEGDLVALIVEETAPGFDPDWPDGRLTIVALDGGSADEREGGMGEPRLMHEGALPGGVMSGERFYPSAFQASGDDVLGMPWVHDLVGRNQELNVFLSLRGDWLRKFSRPPMIANEAFTTFSDPKGFSEGSPIWNHTGGPVPQFLMPPQGQGEVQAFIVDVRTVMDTLGGYNAASQGQLKAGTSGYAVRQLAAYDDTMFGTAANGIARSNCSLMQKCHALVREHLTVPWLIRTVGGDNGYLASPYIHREQLSAEPPRYQLVSAQGTEADRVGELDKLVVMADGAGTPVFTAEDYRRSHPDRGIFPPENETSVLKRRRALGINAFIVDAAMAWRTETGIEIGAEGSEGAEKEGVAAILAELNRDNRTRIMRDDEIQFHIDTLSEITQDGESDPVAVGVAEGRQDAYYATQQQQAAGAQMQGQPPQGGQQQAGQPQQITQDQQAQGSSEGMMQQTAPAGATPTPGAA